MKYYICIVYLNVLLQSTFHFVSCRLLESIQNKHFGVNNFEIHADKTAVNFPFRNVTLPWNERVDDLVSRLYLYEIQEQLARGGAGTFGGPAPAILRLGIGSYQWDTECLRGDADAPGVGATAFPQSIGLAAAFR